jgi:hypothetical protein
MGAKLVLFGVCPVLVMIVALVGLSWANHLSTDVEGHTTVDETICAGDPSTGLSAIEVYDGGPDGDPGTANNTLFARQGVFVP